MNPNEHEKVPTPRDSFSLVPFWIWDFGKITRLELKYDISEKQLEFQVEFFLNLLFKNQWEMN